MLKQWRIVVSTIQFGRRIEIVGERVFGDTPAQAQRQAEALGLTTMTGWKFERLVEVGS